MGANNTPIPDLIELSSINANATFTAAPGGGGDIIGVVDNGTYTDSDGSNSSTQIAELNDGGTLTIDGVDYVVNLVVPDGLSEDVTVTYNGGASSTNLSGDGYDTEIAFIVASPVGGGANRYFAAIDDGIGNLPDITSIQTRDLDFSPSGSDVKINLDQNQNVAPVCFTYGTLIETEDGPVPVERLQVGDRVATCDEGFKAVRWIGERWMAFGPGSAQHRPVQIKRGALGDGLPRRDMAVSPQHRILIGGAVVLRLFGVDEVLARAKGLVGLRGVRVMNGRRQEVYVSVMLNRHQVILAEGLKCESFYPGPMALQMLPPHQRAEIKVVFPRLKDDPDTGYGPPARPVLTLKETAHLATHLGPALSAAAAQRGPVLEVVRGAFKDRAVGRS